MRPVMLLTALGLTLGLNAASSAPRGVFPVLLVEQGNAGVGWLMGGSVDGRWVDQDGIAPKIQGGESYMVPNAKGATTKHSGGKPSSIDPNGGPCNENRSVDLSPSVNFAANDPDEKIALVTTWNPRPRRATELAASNPTYQSVIAELLRAKGILKPEVKITRVLRVDLEGDKQDEVIINATRHGFFEGNGINPNSSAGDYSLILVRKIVAGKLQNILLEGEFYPKDTEFNAPNIKIFRDVLDLNGDGRLEIVFSSNYYEGNYTGVYDWQGTKFEEVIGYGCGV